MTITKDEYQERLQEDREAVEQFDALAMNLRSIRRSRACTRSSTPSNAGRCAPQRGGWPRTPASDCARAKRVG